LRGISISNSQDEDKTGQLWYIILDLLNEQYPQAIPEDELLEKVSTKLSIPKEVVIKAVAHLQLNGYVEGHKLPSPIVVQNGEIVRPSFPTTYLITADGVLFLQKNKPIPVEEITADIIKKYEAVRAEIEKSNERIEKHDKEISQNYTKIIEIFGVFIAIFSLLIVFISGIIPRVPDGMIHALVYLSVTLFPLAATFYFLLWSVNFLILGRPSPRLKMIWDWLVRRTNRRGTRNNRK
jgi:hypothetical protein